MNVDTSSITKEICKIAECVFEEEIHIEYPNSNYTQSYSVYKQDREIAVVIKFYNGFAVYIPLFRGNAEFIKAVTLALSDVEVKGVPWTP